MKSRFDKIDTIDIVSGIIHVSAVIIILIMIGAIAYIFWYDATHTCVEYKTVTETRCNESGGFTRCWTEDIKVCEKYE